MNITNDTEPDYRLFLTYSRFWVQRILVPTLMTIGIVGNVVTIVIMTRRRMRSSTNNYLAALATFDMMYLVFTFVLSLSHYPRIPDSDHYAYWKLRPFILMLTDTCSNTSVWLTVTFTVERYIAVCHPMRGKVFCTESRAKKAIVAVFLFCFAFTLPTPFEWRVVQVTRHNRTFLALAPSEMGNDELYKTIYYWVTVVFFTFLPLTLLAIFNSFLIRSVHLSKLQRTSMTRSGEGGDSSQENKITIMLIAVVILFFLCQLPTACHLLYSTTAHEAATESQLNLMAGLGNIFNFLMSLNSAGNFVLYCLLSQKYRRTFVLIFCPCVGPDRRNTTFNSTYYQSTVVTEAPTDSPGGSSGSRRPSNSRLSGRATDSPAGGSRTVFLQVPSKVVYEDEEDSNPETGARANCSAFRKVLTSPWRRLKNTVLGEKSATREQVIPLKGGGNKCIVITAPEGMPDNASHSI